MINILSLQNISRAQFQLRKEYAQNSKNQFCGVSLLGLQARKLERLRTSVRMSDYENGTLEALLRGEPELVSLRLFCTNAPNVVLTAFEKEAPECRSQKNDTRTYEFNFTDRI